MKSFRKEDILGKPVIETSGTVKGKVKDVMFDLSSTITLIVEGLDGKESQIPIVRVTGISDNVVVKSELPAAAPTPSTGMSCKFCGKPMSPGQTWCPSCGKSQT
jgi:sporulation protein YlmC with PRC-barrel domain